MVALAALMLKLLGAEARLYEFPITQNDNNHLYYRSYVQDLCVDIVQSDARPCSVSQDCSPLLRYDCSIVQTSEAEVTFGDGPEVQMSLQGYVQLSSLQSCGEGNCPWCTNHQSCVGPMVETDRQQLAAGSCIVWEYSTQNSSEAFEFFVGAFSDSLGDLVAYELKRGDLQLDWSYGQLQVPQSGQFFLRFFLASYDSSGGGRIGSILRIRNVRPEEPCLSASVVAEGPKSSTVTSSSSSSSSATRTTSRSSSTTASSTVSRSSTFSSSSRSATPTTTSESSTSFTGSTSATSTSSTTRTRSATSTATSVNAVVPVVAEQADAASCETSEILLVLLSLGAFFVLLLLTALCRSTPGDGTKSVSPENSKLDRMLQVLRGFGLEDEEDLKAELHHKEAMQTELRALRMELDRERAKNQELEALRQAHFALQHRLMNETRLCAELRRTAAAREVTLIMPPDDRWLDDEGLLT